MTGDTRFRQMLEDGDVDGLRQYWHHVAPNMPQPQSREAAEIVMHMTRTEAASVAFRKRAYSHRWLTERNMPSKLPDVLRPGAERMYPKVVEAVMVAVEFRSKYLRAAALEVRGEINKAIEDCYASGDTDPALVRKQMDEARVKTMKALFGRL